MLYLIYFKILNKNLFFINLYKNNEKILFYLLSNNIIAKFYFIKLNITAILQIF